MAKYEWVDQHGAPIEKAKLTQEQAGDAEFLTSRQVQPEHPSWGLSPEGLASILLTSESHDPSRWYALCDDVEEREWHYRAVLSQRRGAIATLPITVDPASDDKRHLEHADFMRKVVLTPEFTLTAMDLCDALGKGMAFGEIMWDTSANQWKPDRIALRETTWFRYDRLNLRTPMILGANGQAEPLWPAKWITHRARLKTGIPVRDGLTRAAVWAWMFKNFDMKAWMIFLNKYGHPLRWASFPPSASPTEKARLLSALRNIGLDAAGIFPQGMDPQFVEASKSGGDAFQGHANYLDEQLSKLTVGQTGTTDASKGGYAVGRVHQGVREDICQLDGIILACTIMRDLVRPCIDFNFGPQDAYPLIKIGLGDNKNVELILKNTWEAIDRGAEIEVSQVLALLGFTEPAVGKAVKLMRPRATTTITPGEEPGGSPPGGDDDRAGRRSGGGPRDRRETSAAADDPPPAPPHDTIDEATEEILRDLGWAPDISALQAALAKCKTIEEARAVLRAHLDKLGTEKLADMLARTRFSAFLAGDTEA